MFKIYGLVDPRDFKIFYVGRTAKVVARRLREHLAGDETLSLKQQRIEAIKLATDKPISVIVLESNILTEKQAFCKEVFWMETLIKSGAELTNASVDFNGTYFLREDTIEANPAKSSINDTPNNDEYISASHSWNEDVSIVGVSEKDALEQLNKNFFMIEKHVIQGNALKQRYMCPKKLRQKRLTNLRNGRKANHGLPIFDEEIRELLIRYSVNDNTAVLSEYFQRSEASIEVLIEENYVN